MRKFLVLYDYDDESEETHIIELKENEKANSFTFRSKIKEIYPQRIGPFRIQSWSLIEE